MYVCVCKQILRTLYAPNTIYVVSYNIIPETLYR